MSIRDERLRMEAKLADLRHQRDTAEMRARGQRTLIRMETDLSVSDLTKLKVDMISLASLDLEKTVLGMRSLDEQIRAIEEELS